MSTISTTASTTASSTASTTASSTASATDTVNPPDPPKTHSIAAAAYTLIDANPIRDEAGGFSMPALPDSALTREAVHGRLSLIAARLELMLVEHVDQIGSNNIRTPPAYEKFMNAVQNLSRLTAIRKSLEDYLLGARTSPSAAYSINQLVLSSNQQTTNNEQQTNSNLQFPSLPVRAIPSCPTLPIEAIPPMLNKIESALTEPHAPNSQPTTHNSQPVQSFKPDNCPDCAHCSTPCCEKRQASPNFLTCDKKCGACPCSADCYYSPSHPHIDPG